MARQTQKANPTFDQFKNVYGLTTNENDDMKDMQSTMNEAISNGASGAMMQVSTNHVLYAHKMVGKIHFRNGKGYCRLVRGSHIANTMLHAVYLLKFVKITK